jgi:hypothetical protein
MPGTEQGGKESVAEHPASKPWKRKAVEGRVQSDEAREGRPTKPRSRAGGENRQREREKGEVHPQRERRRRREQRKGHRRDEAALSPPIGRLAPGNTVLPKMGPQGDRG